MAQKIVGYVRFQVPAGKATPAPPVGPALGQYGVNIGQFTKDFNERTKGDMGMMIPVVITVYSDRTFSFITKTPPAALLINELCALFIIFTSKQFRFLLILWFVGWINPPTGTISRLRLRP